MKKLSELKDDEILLVGDEVISKEDLLNDSDFIEEKYTFKIYTTKKYIAKIDAEDMIENALEHEYDNMYDDWYSSIINDVTKEDIEDIQNILDRILSRSKSSNISYSEDEEVEFDM